MSEPSSELQQIRIRPIYTGALLGWIMDAFDLSMMFLLVPVLAEVFFPANYGLAIVGIWSIYTTTFIFRPVGGLLFGHVGDRIGRKGAMVITLTGLGLVIFATGFLPTYVEIGIAAPVLLFLLRIVTGIFAGGEYGNSAVLLTESVKSSRRGAWGAAIQSGYPIGYTLAATVFLWLNFTFRGAAFSSGGWRWMFWLGIIPAIVGLIIRLAMPESAMWTALRRGAGLSKAPVSHLFRNRSTRVGALTGILAMTGISWVYGLTLGFYPTILSLNRFMLFPSFLYVVIAAILTSLVGYLISGIVSDRIGRRATMMIYSVLALVFAIPFTLLIRNHALGVFGTGLFASILAFLTTGIYGVIPSFLSEKFPTSVRSTGVGIGFNGGFIMGNWSTAFLLLLTGVTNPYFYAYWGTFIIIGELCILLSSLLSKETKQIDLRSIQ